MFRKLLITLCIATIFSLVGSSGIAFASNGASKPMPTWQTVFDPNAKTPGTNIFIPSIEVFKGDLYAVAGDPLWWHTDNPPKYGGQLFRSQNGKNWEPASAPGFGLGSMKNDCGTDYYDMAEDMTVFQGKLYVDPSDICYEQPGVIMRTSDGKNWEIVATTQELGITWTHVPYPGFGQFHGFSEFNGMLYIGIDAFDPVANNSLSMIYRSPNGNPGTWKEVINFPGWAYPGPLHVFNGALYVVSDGVITPSTGPGYIVEPEQIWRTFDGVNWKEVVGDGFGITPSGEGLGGFAEYQGNLYVGAPDVKNGGQIWRSHDGKHWKPVVQNGFGNPNNIKVDGLVVYQGELYAYTLNNIDGGSVYRTRDTKTWEAVNQPGWGNPNYYASHLNADQAVFKGNLYMGVVGLQGVLLKMVP